MIPPFVRKTLDAMGLPGYRVLPWEKDADGTLRDPAKFPVMSVATWSTHDTAPLLAWWPELPEKDRDAFDVLAKTPKGATTEQREEALFGLLFGASSDLALVLAPELFGETTRINEPGKIGPENWTYRVPVAVDAPAPAIAPRITRFSKLLRASGRAAT